MRITGVGLLALYLLVLGSGYMIASNIGYIAAGCLDLVAGALDQVNGRIQ